MSQKKKTNLKINLVDREKVRLSDLVINKSSSLSMNQIHNKSSIFPYPVYGANEIIGFTNNFLSVDEYIGVLKDGAGVGRIVECSGKSNILGTLTALIPLKDIANTKYISSFLQTIKWDKHILGSTIPHIYYSDYKNLKIPNLPLKKQNKIADFLSSIDILIEKQEECIELIKIKKQGYSKIIFKDNFEDREENQKISNLFYIDNVGVDKKTNINEKEVNLLNYMDIYQRKIYTNMKVTTTLSNLEKCKVNINDIYITPSSETVEDIMHAYAIKEHLQNYVYSYHIMRLRPILNKINSIFMEEQLNSLKSKKRFSKLCQGAQRYTLSKKEIENFKLYTPSLEKQNKIANLLSSMDNLIELNQEKLEQLKLKKKYYLNEIFG